jgi:hypothetical protein
MLGMDGGNYIDPAVATDEYTEAAERDRLALVGRSYGWELLLATVIAVVFLGWATWAFLF